MASDSGAAAGVRGGWTQSTGQHSIMVRSSRSRGCASTLLIGAVALLLPARTPGSVFLCAVTDGGCPQGRADVGTVLGCREYADAGGCQQVSADFFLAQARTVQPFVSLFTSPSALNQPVRCALITAVFTFPADCIFHIQCSWERRNGSIVSNHGHVIDSYLFPSTISRHHSTMSPASSMI